MGPVGNTLGSALGNMAGNYIGKKYLGDDYKGQTALIGSTLGGLAGSLIPGFKNGGRVPGKKKGEPKIILAHSGEFILPTDIKPTKEQRSLIEKRKKQKREKKVELFV
jgi:uncharacterized protein YcfJ